MKPQHSLKPQHFQILLSLSDGPRHGQGIMAEVLNQTDGAMRLWPTSLYGSLKTLSADDYIAEYVPDDRLAAGDRRRFYEITDSGLKVLTAELSRLERTLELARGKKVLGYEG